MQYRFTRRKFLLAAGSSVVVGLGTSGCAQALDRQLSFSRLSQAITEMHALENAKALNNLATFNFAQTLVHCAQSIEYSMSGYPDARSSLFQHTLGAAAFKVFEWRGRMTHDLAEPIPGAPVLNPMIEIKQAIERLHSAIAQFHAWRDPFKPHFAYGELDKQQYELAHAMHLANHFSHFKIKT